MVTGFKIRCDVTKKSCSNFQNMGVKTASVVLHTEGQTSTLANKRKTYVCEEKLNIPSILLFISIIKIYPLKVDLEDNTG